jgi:hypothetical protein
MGSGAAVERLHGVRHCASRSGIVEKETCFIQVMATSMLALAAVKSIFRATNARTAAVYLTAPAPIAIGSRVV